MPPPAPSAPGAPRPLARFWHEHPHQVALLAGEYTLGTLRGGARRRFETLLLQRHDFGAAVAQWHDRMAPVLLALPPQAPSPATWRAIEQRLGLAHAAGATKTPSAQGSWWRRLLQPAPAGALALGLMAGVLLPSLWRADPAPGPAGVAGTQLPESYVGVLAVTADGRPGLIVSSLRHGRTVDLKRLAPVEVPSGQRLYLWAIDSAGVATPLVPLPAGPLGPFVSLELPQPAETLFARAVELAVSIEDASGPAPVQPAGGFVYRGLCGKLWRAR